MSKVFQMKTTDMFLEHFVESSNKNIRNSLLYYFPLAYLLYLWSKKDHQSSWLNSTAMVQGARWAVFQCLLCSPGCVPSWWGAVGHEKGGVPVLILTEVPRGWWPWSGMGDDPVVQQPHAAWSSPQPRGWEGSRSNIFYPIVLSLQESEKWNI